MKCKKKQKIYTEKAKSQSSLPSVELDSSLSSFCNEDELQLTSDLVVVTASGLIDALSESGPSAAILLHSASQLLITSVNLPLSSPISTCKA